MNTTFCPPHTRLPLHSACTHEGASSVQQIEQRGFNAWPAPRSAVVGDWLLRSAAGYTRRANSANALQPGATLTAALLRQIEGYYAQQRLSCIFRISPLVDARADALLQAEGYQLVDPSIVMQRPTQAGDADWGPAAGLQLLLDPDFQQSWLDGHCAASARPPEHKPNHRNILQSIGMRCAYAALMQGAAVRAWGLAVFERDAVGLYEVMVHPAHRGQGLGRQMVQGLLHWAGQQGAMHADLQVQGDNLRARQLYASLGFAPAYDYHYRIRP